MSVETDELKTMRDSVDDGFADLKWLMSECALTAKQRASIEQWLIDQAIRIYDLTATTGRIELQAGWRLGKADAIAKLPAGAWEAACAAVISRDVAQQPAIALTPVDHARYLIATAPDVLPGILAAVPEPIDVERTSGMEGVVQLDFSDVED